MKREASEPVKRVAPNEPTLRARARPGMGRGRKDEVQSTKDEKGRSCGIEEVVRGQFSVVSRVFSGDPQGSAGELRSTDFGLGIQQSGPGAPATGHDVRIMNHGSRKTSVAEQSHLVASSRPYMGKADRCLFRCRGWCRAQTGRNRFRGGASTHASRSTGKQAFDGRELRSRESLSEVRYWSCCLAATRRGARLETNTQGTQRCPNQWISMRSEIP